MMIVILSRLTAHAPVKRGDDLHVILSRERSETAKDLKSRISEILRRLRASG